MRTFGTSPQTGTNLLKRMMEISLMKQDKEKEKANDLDF